MSDNRGIALSAGGLQVVVTNANATNVFCQVYVKPVACPETPDSAISDEAAAICVVSNVLYAYSDTNWVDTGITNNSLTNGTWVGLAAHLDYNAERWDLFYTIGPNFSNEMTRVNDGSYLFNDSHSGSTFQELIITNESSVTTHVDAVAVSLSYSPTDVNAHTNLAIFERVAGEDQVLAIPPVTYAAHRVFDFGQTRFGKDLSIGLFAGDEVLTPGGETYTLASSGTWSWDGGAQSAQLTNTAEGLLLTRLPGSDTLAFYPYSNLVAWSSSAEARGTNHTAKGRTDLVVPATFPGGCIDINDNQSMGFDGEDGGDQANEWDEILFYNASTKRTRKFQYVLATTSSQVTDPDSGDGDWLYKGRKVDFEVCPGAAFMYYNKQSGDITWILAD
jgi:hypothetical protein